jgi:hypothetical protein
MNARARLTLVAVLTFAPAGCSGAQGVDNQPAAASPPAASPSPAGGAEVEATCQEVNTLMVSFVLAEASALGGDAQGAALRAQVAAAYRGLYESLRITAWNGPNRLLPALSEWAGASREVGEYVATTTPPKNLVVDFGPDYPKWTAAKEKAEKICGHELPGSASPNSS